MNILLKSLKTTSDWQFKIEILETIERILFGLNTAGQPIHKEIYKQLKPIASQERLLAVRCAAIKCLCEMTKHSTFLYSPFTISSSSSLNQGGNLGNLSSSGGTGSMAASSVAVASAELDSIQACNELAVNIQLGFKALDTSNYDVRKCASVYLAQLIYYSLMQLHQQQIVLQQQLQMANVLASGNSYLENPTFNIWQILSLINQKIYKIYDFDQRSSKFLNQIKNYCVIYCLFI